MASFTPMYRRFQGRLDCLEKNFTEWMALASGNGRTDAELMFLEGLVSSLWQHWSLFCRRIVIASSLGCVSRSGVEIIPCVSPLRWERVSYIATSVKFGNKISDNKII